MLVNVDDVSQTIDITFVGTNLREQGVELWRV